MAGQRIGSGGAGRVGSKLGDRVTLVVGQVVVGQEIVAEDELPPRFLTSRRIVRQNGRLLAAMAPRTIVGERDLATAEHVRVICQVIPPALGRLAVACLALWSTCLSDRRRGSLR